LRTTAVYNTSDYRVAKLFINIITFQVIQLKYIKEKETRLTLHEHGDDDDDS